MIAGGNLVTCLIFLGVRGQLVLVRFCFLDNFRTIFSCSRLAPPGAHLPAGSLAYSLTLCPLALISATCGGDGGTGLSWSTLFTPETHGSQLLGGWICVYEGESSLVCSAPGKFWPALTRTLISPSSSCHYSVPVSLDIEGESGIIEWLR